MKRIEKLIYKSLDLQITEKEKLKLEKALKDSPELRKQMDEITMIRHNAAQKQHNFSPWFDAKVMHSIKELSSAPSAMAFPFKTYRTATLIGFATIAAILVITLILNGSLSLNAITGLNSINADNLFAFVAFDF